MHDGERRPAAHEVAREGHGSVARTIPNNSRACDIILYHIISYHIIVYYVIAQLLHHNNIDMYIYIYIERERDIMCLIYSIELFRLIPRRNPILAPWLGRYLGRNQRGGVIEESSTIIITIIITGSLILLLLLLIIIIMIIYSSSMIYLPLDNWPAPRI